MEESAWVRSSQPKRPAVIEDVADLLVDGGLGDLAALDCGGEVLRVHELAGGHLEVEAAVGRADGVVGRVPVGHHHAVEAPLLADDLGVEVAVLGHVLAVGEVVGVHDGADVGLADGGLEGGQIDLADGALVDDGVGVVAQELGVVAHEVLDGGADALGLHAVDVADGDVGGEEGIFAEVLEVAAVAGRAVDVDAGAEHEVDAARAGIASDAFADAGCQIAVPRGGEADAGGIGGGGEAGVAANAVGAVGHLEGRQIEAGHGANGEAGAADVFELLLEGHLAR